MSKIISIVDEIAKFTAQSDPYCSEHDDLIRRGKVLLRLMTTIGQPEFFEWLSSAVPKGNYYEFRRYRIVRRATRTQDVVRMDNYPEFRKAAAEFAGIDSDNSTISILLQIMESARLRDKQDKSQQFLDATVLMVAKLARFMRKPSFQPGDIIFADDPVEDIHLTLLDLFMMQENLDQESEAVELLCSKFNIPDKPFVPLEYDRRTRWTLNTKYISPRQELDTENRIVFQTADELLGIVELKDGRILAPTTYWSKNLDSPLREFTVPWAKKAPLWNLDLIKKWGKESTIFLTDSLVAAHAAFREIRKQASKLEQKIHELEHRDRLEYRRFGAGDFERELEDAVYKKLKNRYLEYEFPGIYDLDFRLARFLYCTNNEFNQFPIRVQKTDSGDAHARYKFYRYLIQHRSPQKTITQCRQEMEKQYRSLDNSFDECAGEVPDGHQVFSDICELMDEYIEARKKSDQQELACLRLELENLGKQIVSSWYGGVDSIGIVDLSPLRNRQVTYLIRQHSREAYQLALWIAVRLKRELGKAHPRLAFLDLSSGKREPFSAEKLRELAEDQFGLTEDALEIPSPDIPASSATCEELDFAHPIPPIDAPKLLLSPLICENSITLMYSEPGCGKTFLAQTIALALSYGTSVWNATPQWKAERPCRVLYVDSEMNKYSFFNRLRLLKDRFDQLGTQEKLTAEKFKYISVTQEDWDLTDESGMYRDRISKLLKLGSREQVDVLILDNLTTLSGGQDTIKSRLGLFVWLRALAARGCSTILLHHANKAGDQRGTSVKSATVDNIIRIRKGLPTKKRNLALTVSIEKARNVDGTELTPLTLELRKLLNGPYQWVTTKAKGKCKISDEERDQMIFKAFKSDAFNQKVLGDYFGLELSYVKEIIKNQTEKAEEKIEDNVAAIFAIMNNEKLTRDIAAYRILQLFKDKKKKTLISKRLTELLNGVCNSEEYDDDDEDDDDED